MKRKRLIQTHEFQPDSPVSIPFTPLDAGTWNSLAQSLFVQIQIQLSNREALDKQLDLNNSLYEMRAADDPSNDAYAGDPNIMVPFICSAVEEFTSRIVGSSLLPRPLVVRGNDPVSAPLAHTVEQFYNGEYLTKKWDSAFKDCIHLAARDGTSVMSIMWDISTTTRLVDVEAPQPDGTTKKIKHRIKITDYNAPRLVPVELRDFWLFPAWAKDIESADAVVWKQYLGENALKKMVRAGTLDADMVEKALSYTNTAQGDLTFDPQGFSTYTINNRINVSDTSVAPPQGMFMTRGPIEVLMIHSNQYDLDGDGEAEENIFWMHYNSQTLLGHVPFEYWAGRPYVSYAPFPRPNRFYGFSIPERLRWLQKEADTQHIGRLELLDWLLNPTMVISKGVRMEDEDEKIGKHSMLEVREGTSPRDAVAFIGPPDVPQSNLQEEMMLKQYASDITGSLQSPGSPPPGSIQTQTGGRNSARQAQMMAAAQGQNTNLVLQITRKFMAECFNYAHKLYCQYGPDQMMSVDSTAIGSQEIQVPRETLAQNYTLTVAGQGGPLDKENRRQEQMMLNQYLATSPFVQGNLLHRWALDADMLETFDKPEVTRYIGTLEEAQQMQQQQAQAQQAQQAMEMTKDVLTHAKIGSNGAPQHGNPGGENQGPTPGG